MKFRTEIEIASFAAKAQIGYENHVLALGSCFAGEMTSRLQQLRFRCTTNPTGVLFNPASIASALRTFADKTPIQHNELYETAGLYHHFDFHSAFSHPDSNAALTAMHAARQVGSEMLRTADRVILTFGTAWVYRRNGRIVANCHRHPTAEFTRHRLSTEQIVTAFSALADSILSDKQIILTVSPVRHLGDGLEENSLSKAVLRLAAAELAERHPNIHYFPAFEILTDDLRDYRFYANDLVHPAQQAVEYIWEKFSQALLSDKTRRLTESASRIVAAAAHRPQHPDTETFRTFCRSHVELIDTLPEIDFSEERHHFEKYLQ